MSESTTHRRRWMLGFAVLFAGIGVCLGPWNTAYAARIFSAIHLYAFNGNPDAVQIAVEVFDNYNGDYSKYLWKYTVTNNSYDPEPGTTNGFSGFETALPVGVSFPDLGNITAPSPLWVDNCCSGNPVEWDLPASSGLGVMPGSTGVFEFTSSPRSITTSTGWFHTWIYDPIFGDYQDYIVDYPAGDGPEVPDVLTSSLVDPDPDLLTTLAEVEAAGSISAPGCQVGGASCASALATKGRVVKGAAADGVSEVLVRIQAAQAGVPYTVSLSSPNGEDGELRTLSNAATATSVTVTSVSTPVGPMAFALYIPPKAFARASGVDDNLASRTVTVQAADQSSGTTSSVSIELVRPPVVLIHGLWSDPTTWNFFNPSTSTSFANPTDPRFHIYRADYQKTNASHIALNGAIVMTQVMNFIHVFRDATQVAAVQADIVAHSMGGDIARQFALFPDYLSPEDYHKGIIHRLITIDTPHLGSEFANKLASSDLLCHAVWGAFGHSLSDGAIDDLSVGSVAMTTLAQQRYPIETHVIIGEANPAQTQTVESNYNSSHMNLLCPSILPNDDVTAVLGTSSDLVVSAHSQSGAGLGYNGNAIPANTTSGVIHAVGHTIYTLGPDALSRTNSGSATVFQQTPNPSLVVQLLNAPANTANFAPMKP